MKKIGEASTQLEAADDLANAADFLLRCRSGRARWDSLAEALARYDGLRGEE